MNVIAKDVFSLLGLMTEDLTSESVIVLSSRDDGGRSDFGVGDCLELSSMIHALLIIGALSFVLLWP
jgi:hypothetical protein